MSLTARFKTNKDSEINGVELLFPEVTDKNGKVPSVTVARANIRNPAYAAQIEALQKKYKNGLNFLTTEQRAKIYREAFVVGCVKNWNNILLADVTGNESDEGYADFNRENAIRLFENLPEFADHIMNEAGDVATFQDEVNQAIAKNSQAS